jgi:hypothetical protein
MASAARLAAARWSMYAPRAMRLALVTLLALAATCERTNLEPAPAAPPETADSDAPAAAPAPDEPTVVLRDRSGARIRIGVEVVRTDENRRRGLMFRKHLPRDRGMLFIFDQEAIQSFWMKNTLIPLDMIFIDRELRIAGVVHNALPLTLESRRVERPSIYVLEVNGGLSELWGLEAGAAIELENVAL